MVVKILWRQLDMGEIFSYLNSQTISFKVSKESGMYKILDKLLSSTNNQRNIKKKLNNIGDKILKLYLKVIDKYLK